MLRRDSLTAISQVSLSLSVSHVTPEHHACRCTRSCIRRDRRRMADRAGSGARWIRPSRAPRRRAAAAARGRTLDLRMRAAVRGTCAEDGRVSLKCELTQFAPIPGTAAAEAHAQGLRRYSTSCEWNRPVSPKIATRGGGAAASVFSGWSSGRARRERRRRSRRARRRRRPGSRRRRGRAPYGPRTTRARWSAGPFRRDLLAGCP